MIEENKDNKELHSFFGRIKKEEDIDEFTFINWKSSLQKELPSFWQDMNNFKP